MAWTPNQDVETVVGQLCARAAETASRWADDAINDEAERESAKGKIGARLGTATIRFREEQLQRSIQPAIDETFDLFTQVYGFFSPEAAEWARGYFTARIDRLSEVIGRGVAGLYSRPEHRALNGGIERVAAGLKRDLQIRLAPIEIRGRLRALATGTLLSDAPGHRKFDVFISHASEDLESVTRPLFERLTADGYVVWLDRSELKVGMSLFNAIDEGLAACRFGVVVLSPSFFAKSWPRRELGALAALADSEGKSTLLPVWHDLTRDDVVRYSPLLADILAVATRDGLESVVAELERAMGPPQASQGQSAGTIALKSSSIPRKL